MADEDSGEENFQFDNTEPTDSDIEGPRSSSSKKTNENTIFLSHYLITINSNVHFPTEDKVSRAERSKIWKETTSNMNESIKHTLTLRNLKSLPGLFIIGGRGRNTGGAFPPELILSVKSEGKSEVGGLQRRIHIHILLTIKHYGHLRLDYNVLREALNTAYQVYTNYDTSLYIHINFVRTTQNVMFYIIKQGDGRKSKSLTKDDLLDKKKSLSRLSNLIEL